MMDKIVKFVYNIDPKVWITILLAADFFLAIWVFSIAITGVTGYLQGIEDGILTRENARTEMIVRVKRECDLVHKNIRTIVIDYTYRCDDGIEYTFEEWI